MQMQSEDQICKIVRTHFLKLREEQKQDKSKEKPLTDDLKFTFSIVNHNVSNPVQTLKIMGIIYLGDSVALNLSLFQTQVICCKSRTLQLLQDENWKESTSKNRSKLAALIGANDVKNWMVFDVPETSDLQKYLRENRNLVATEHSFGLDQSPEVILIGPGLPPDDVLIEPHFPLVSIQYERVLDTSEVIDFSPTPCDFKRKISSRLSLFKSSIIEIPYTKVSS